MPFTGCGGNTPTLGVARAPMLPALLCGGVACRAHTTFFGLQALCVRSLREVNPTRSQRACAAWAVGRARTSA